ncbi:OLC1v1020027C1 [Oldenlandia corymbosa var. corymbosa]|uniref:OLC1v1020027C1 n=1 Tax=Oldenlandia corymbosa var. corymbosa TaxID=529605 RepID=A0AAV1EFI3_OLDCO|nr:OLC1v1020027C1 [Oldenlandia corymbosa var. corymbosa]
MDTSRRSRDGPVSILMEAQAPFVHVKNHESLPSSVTLHEGISLLLSRWFALQMAVQNEWGGDDSFYKSQLLVSEIESWFSQPKNSVNLEDLESLLHERLLLSFNTEIEDGSIEEVAEELMTMHEESLHHGNLVRTTSRSQQLN